MTAFLIAAVLAGGITYLFWKRVNANSQKHSATQIVAAATDLPIGVTLAAKDVMLLDWYGDVIPSGAIVL